ncbi:outer membrane beta-barrel protein [Pararcticibacter amylolyticus]|uniref:Outer membrane protein beta-barrel domain-containing protein n=1 Tax=Pararcticibacter amylolyticus TaxID=2173175 RepID=A0A2U2PKP5_9SPHI|nr:outer membrane beta-barrel protein [Pararcticibacter amylolyticus]PWG81844.1 hypothetical protein DDR33_05680 [Pararcticibacter amylolyticus]
MKKYLLLFLSLILTNVLFAQVAREVSGIVKDSTDTPVIGALVILSSSKDTLKTSTNNDGIFIFKNAPSGQFILTVRSIGYVNYNKRFLYNDATKRLVLDPVILKSQANMLKEVTVNGTPAVTYKEDTVEYRASDYKVRENASVDELLKKMEGVEVANDGTVTAQGTQVTKARLNGKDYAGGDVASAIQNLPADIVEKIQIVDDYGDQAARTGIKDGDPRKVLNIVTRADRSVGNTGRLNAGAGSNDRYGLSVFGTRINANQQVNANLSFNNTVNGVANNSGGQSLDGGNFRGGNGGGRGGGGSGGSYSGLGGGSGGTTRTGRGSLGYRDQLNKKLSINSSYSYNFNDVNSINSSTSESYVEKGTIYSTNESSGGNDANNHSFNFDLEYDIDSANYLRIQPSLSFSSTLTSNQSNIRTRQAGYLNQLTEGSNSSKDSRPSLEGSVLYQHIFKKQGRNFSLNINYSRNNQTRDNEQNNIITYYQLNSDDFNYDSLVHRLVQRKNLNNTLRASMTFSERLSPKSRIDFNGQVNRRSYDNSAYTNNIGKDGSQLPIDSLTNLFNYSFTESRFSLNYRFNVPKFNFALGMTAIPTLLTGTKVHLDATSRRANFFLIPIARVEYQFSRQHRLSLNYSGNASEPTFDQIQPVRDVSNPNHPIVGNPDLKAAFNHTIAAAYNNYIANARLNYSVNLNARFVSNSVVSNLIQVPMLLSKGDTTYINETHYLNLNGASSYNCNYNISKSFADRKYSFHLNGSITNRNGVSMSENRKNESTTWTFSQRLGPQINPVEWLEVNPNVSYIYTKADFTLSSNNSRVNNFAINGDGRIYIHQTWLFSFSASKNYVSGINANQTSNPFVINTGFEKQFFKRKNGAISLQCFDLLKQNNFVNRTISDYSRTDVKTNALSRYVMLNFRWQPQKWSGSPRGRSGRQMMRRGDGSFY